MEVDERRRDAVPMYTGSTIVCAVDDSDAGRAAAVVAARLAERLDRRLVGAHAVLPLPLTAAGVPYGIPHPDAEATERYESAAAAHAREVLEQAGAGDASLRTEVGQVADVLLHTAEHEDGLMLVVGASEGGPLRSLLLDSVQDALLRTADRPVLLVPAGGELMGDGPVLAAVGGQHDAAWTPMAELLALARNGHLVLAHVLEHEDAVNDPVLAEAESRVDAFDPALRTLGPTEALIETRVGFGDAGERLLALARSADASMVVTGSHRHSRLHAALLGSTARALIRHAGVPTLVCPARV